MLNFAALLGGISPAAFAGTAATAFFFCAISVGGGIGGGALYMPIYVFVTKDAHIAVPLSKVTTNGVGWSAFLFNFWLKHPNNGGPLIDYDVALVLEPLTLVGTILGVVLNMYSTTAEVLIMLVCVLFPTAWKTMSKGCEQYELDDEDEESESEEEEDEHLLEDHHAKELALPPSASASLEELSEEAREMIEEDRRQYPCVKILLMLFVFAVHAGTLISVGGPKAIICGETWQRLVILALAIFHCTFTLCWRRHMLDRQSEREELELPSSFLSYSIDARSTVVYPLISGFAGVCAGGLGIAGGLIKGPLMVNWGLAPQASTATAIFMILFTSSSTILQFWILGRLNVGQAVCFWCIGFSGGLVGSKIVAELMKRCGRQWQITVGLAILIIASGLSMSFVSVLRLTGVIEGEEGGDGVVVTLVRNFGIDLGNGNATNVCELLASE